jgi:hypothetical protein
VNNEYLKQRPAAIPAADAAGYARLIAAFPLAGTESIPQCARLVRLMEGA